MCCVWASCGGVLTKWRNSPANKLLLFVIFFSFRFLLFGQTLTVYQLLKVSIMIIHSPIFAGLGEAQVRP